MITCGNCQYKNDDGTILCVRCGEPLVNIEPSTRSLGDTNYGDGEPKWGSARLNGSMDLIFDVLETHESFTFDMQTLSQIIIGRRDPRTGDAPDIDLTNSKAVENGVSRHHATITRRDGALHILDNNSANGTYLNGQRLVAHQLRILRDGDDIRLGHLKARVTFRPR